MGRSGSGNKVVMRLAPERKPRMRLALGGGDRQGLENASAVCWEPKARMHRVDSRPCTNGRKKTKRPNTVEYKLASNELRAFSGTEAAAERKEVVIVVEGDSPAPESELLLPPSEAGLALVGWSGPGGPDSLCDNEMAYTTPQQGHAEPTDVCSPASSQDNIPSGESAATSSAGSERRCPELEHLEHPISFQAAAALSELARSKARASVAVQAQRMEREARLRDEAAHSKERERLERAVDELRSQLAALQPGRRCIDERGALPDKPAACDSEIGRSCSAVTLVTCDSPPAFLGTPLQGSETASPEAPTLPDSLPPSTGAADDQARRLFSEPVAPPALPEVTCASPAEDDSSATGPTRMSAAEICAAAGSERLPAGRALVLNHICFWVSLYVPCSARSRWARVCSSTCHAMYRVNWVNELSWGALYNQLGSFQSSAMDGKDDLHNFGSEPGPLFAAQQELLQLKQAAWASYRGPAAARYFPIPARRWWMLRWSLHIDCTVNLYRQMLLRHRELMLEAGRVWAPMRQFGNVLENRLWARVPPDVLASLAPGVPH